MNKKFDARIAFVREVLRQRITDNVKLANEWYIANATKLQFEDAISKFRRWVTEAAS